MQMGGKKHFNKNLAMTLEDEDDFKSSNMCWDGLFAERDNKVRHPDNVTAKYFRT